MRPTETETISRTRGKRKFKKKLIIASEGFRTEQNYFCAIKDEWSGLKFNTIVEPLVLNRFYADAGKSNPLKLAEILTDYMTFIKTGDCSVNLFIGRLIESMIDSDVIQEKDMPQIRNEISSLICEKGLVSDEKISFFKEAEEECMKYFKAKNIPDFDLKSYLIELYEGDEVCMVVYRDDGTISPQVYSELIEKCNKEKFRLFVTNPKFELWIMFHFDEIERLIPDLKDKTKCVRILDDEIRRRHITKQHDFHALVYHIGTAMNISKAFSSDLKDLKSEVGTNLPQLINLMRTGNKQ